MRAKYFGNAAPAWKVKNKPQPPTAGQRRRVLKGLQTAGRRFVRSLLSQITDSKAIDLEIIHALGQSVDRQQELTERIEADSGIVQTIAGLPGVREHPLGSKLRSEIRAFIGLRKLLKD